MPALEAIPALDEILQQHPVWRGVAFARPVETVPTGYSVLDRELPGGGWPGGALTEILGGLKGIGELQILMPALAALSMAGKRIVWLAPPHLPYAPALAAAGVDLTHLAVVRAPGRRDALWAAEQVLRSASCRVLLAWFHRASYAELQRLATAAESGRACVILFRPREAGREPSPACLRLALEPAAGELAVRILKRRGPPAGAPLHVPLKRPAHALGRTPISAPVRRQPRAHRGMGLPVHP
jgi:cell division inhibitor SulA/protein ImuA